MAVKLVALFHKPEDVDAFLPHYNEIHLPLVRKTPHLCSAIGRRVTASPLGEASHFLMAEMRFTNAEHFQEAMRSTENKAAGKALMGFARDLVTLMVVEEEVA